MTIRAYLIATAIGAAILAGVVLARDFLLAAAICGYGACR